MFFVVDPDREVAPQHAAFVWQRLWAMRDLAPISAVMAATPAAAPLPASPPVVPPDLLSGRERGPDMSAKRRHIMPTATRENMVESTT